MEPFLVDVYAIHPRGHDIHLGGGLFLAPSAEAAETMATEEYWKPQLAKQGFDIGFHTDLPGTGPR
ncbi:hypothetical protein [Halomonas sp. E14]|uniref:hypothetical protein n=1 Tax=Halomonas sp. E14 TaxID=3397245 RepID=UPI00403EDA83